MGRWIGRAVVALIAAVLNAAILIVLAWFFVAPRFAGDILIAEARRSGVPLASLKVDRLWPGGVVLSDIRFEDGGPYIQRALVTFQRRDLIDRGELDTVEVSGADLTIAVDESGSISVAGLDTLLADDGADESSSPFSIPRLPVQEIVLDDTDVNLTTPFGPVEIPIDAVLRPIDDGGVVITAELGPEWRGQRAGIVLQGRVDADGAFDAVVSLASERLDWQDISLAGAEGLLVAAGSTSGLSAIEGQLTAARVAYGDRRFGETRIFTLGEDLPDLITVRSETEDRSTRLAADIQITDWATGTPELAVDLTLATDHVASLNDYLPLPEGIDGQALLDVSLTGSLSALADPFAFPLAGDMSAVISQATVPGLLDDLSTEIRADVQWDGTSIALASAERWRITGLLTDLDQPFSIALAPIDDMLRIAVAADGTAGSIQALTQIAVGGFGTVSTRVDVTFEEGDPAGPLVMIERLEGTVSPINLDGLTVTPLEFSLVGVGAAGRFEGDVSMTVAATGTSPSISVDNGVIAFDGRLETDWADIRFFPEGCQIIAFDRFAIERTPLVPISGPICLESLADRPLFVVPTSLAGVTAIDGVIAGLAARIDPEASPLDATIGELTIAGSIVDGIALDLELADASLDIPNDGILIDGIAGLVAMRSNVDDDITLSGPVTAEAIIIAGRPTPMVPLAVEATLSGTLNQPFIEGVGIAERLGLSFPARFSFDGPTGIGRVEVDIPGLRFTEGGLQPRMLFPVLQVEAPLDSVEGRVNGDVLILFGQESVNSAIIRIDDVTIRRPEITLSGVSGTVRLSNFAPPRTNRGQRLTIERAEFGPLFRNGTIAFGVGAGNVVSVSELQFDWAGGEVSAQPFAFDLDNINTDVTLQAQGVSLEEILLEFPVEDLTATGVLDGSLPILLRGETLFVENGRLQSRGPGTIRYAPPDTGEVGDQSLQILFDAIRNFHYDRVAVTLNGSSTADLAVGLEIAGNNPDLFDGYPIDLNVNVSGDLADILRQSVRVLSIGDETREYFEQGGGRDIIENLLGE